MRSVWFCNLPRAYWLVLAAWTRWLSYSLSVMPWQMVFNICSFADHVAPAILRIIDSFLRAIPSTSFICDFLVCRSQICCLIFFFHRSTCHLDRACILLLVQGEHSGRCLLFVYHETPKISTCCERICIAHCILYVAVLTRSSLHHNSGHQYRVQR